MFAIIRLLATFIADLFKSPRRLEVENLFLRDQLNVALRRAPQRVRLRARDRGLMVWMTRMWPSLLGLTRVVQPATLLRWHRCGFRAAQAPVRACRVGSLQLHDPAPRAG